MVAAQRKYNYDEAYRELYKEKKEQKPSVKAKPSRKSPLKAIGIFIELAVIIGALTYLLNGHVTIIKSNIELSSLQREVASIEKENQNLNVTLATLSDISKVEEQAVGAMGMKKPDSSDIVRLQVNYGE